MGTSSDCQLVSASYILATPLSWPRRENSRGVIAQTIQCIPALLGCDRPCDTLAICLLASGHFCGWLTVAGPEEAGYTVDSWEKLVNLVVRDLFDGTQCLPLCVPFAVADAGGSHAGTSSVMNTFPTPLCVLKTTRRGLTSSLTKCSHGASASFGSRGIGLRLGRGEDGASTGFISRNSLNHPGQ